MALVASVAWEVEACIRPLTTQCLVVEVDQVEMQGKVMIRRLRLVQDLIRLVPDLADRGMEGVE